MPFYLVFISVALSLGCSQPKEFNAQYAQKAEQEGWSKVSEILNRINPPTFPKNTFNVLDFGAKGDSVSNDLSAFIAAIDSCSIIGGGTVIIPAGQYFLKGPVKLNSNVHLNLKEGARIFFSQEAKDYLPAVKVRWEGTVCYNYSPLIYGYQLTNVAITGKGIIDGAAQEWSSEWRKLQKPDQKRLRQMGNDTIPEVQRVFANGFLDLDGDGKDDGFGDGQQHFLRPTLIELYECENIL
ncbi:MAG: glycosyl hydrolase family 28-related protein, partial [Bacteroidota bacterium]